MTSDPDRLLEKAVGGDQDALSELLAEVGPQVRARLSGRINPKWKSVLDEDDVMQITYLEAFVQIEQFRPTGSGALLAWLTRIAENNLRDAIRGLERAKRPQPDDRIQPPAGGDSVVALYDHLGATSSTPSRRAARHEIKNFLDDALSRLPEDYAKVVRMYDLEGKAIAQVAKALERSTGAVYMLRSRAHDYLRDLLGRESKFFSTPA